MVLREQSSLPLSSFVNRVIFQDDVMMLWVCSAKSRAMTWQEAFLREF